MRATPKTSSLGRTFLGPKVTTSSEAAAFAAALALALLAYSLTTNATLVYWF